MATQRAETALAEPPDGAEPAAGRRERRKADTRRRLVAAARQLFAQRGYDATRAQDIARAADVAAGTFYLHFADKREAFLAFTDEAAAELMERLRAAPSGADLQSGLEHALEALFEYAEENPGVLGAAFADAAVIAAGVPSGASLRDRLAESLAADLRRGIEKGQLAADYDAFVIAHGIVGLIEAACVHGARRGTARRDLIVNLTRFCARALRPADGGTP